MQELNKSAHETKLDDQLFNEFHRITGDINEYYSYLTIPSNRRAAIISAWENGENPSLLPEESIDIEFLEQKIALLKELKSKIVELSSRTAVQQLYRWKINETIGQLRMLQASKNGDMHRFMQWNVYIYGEPDPYAYFAALDWVAADAEAIMASSDNEDIIDAASTVADLLRDRRGYRELLFPETDVYDQVRDNHMEHGGYFDALLKGVTIPDDMITPDIGNPIVKYVIENNLNSDYSLCEVDRGTWAVSHALKRVEAPRNYRLPRERFIGLPLGHEVGTHLSEYVNGMQGPLLLAAIGLDRFESGAEGRALIREQVPYNTFADFSQTIRWREILRRHIAISYAYGVEDETPKSSSEVYHFMNAIDTMYARNAGQSDDQAKKKTADLLLRVLRGTDGTGGVYLKDKCYLEGNISAWLTAALKGPDAISNGDKAKHDISNPRHNSALLELGVIF